ncbi:nucleolar protein 58 [Spatholobus suberectus]|nr:nucleolar protein 58 [Spatholobus suberectus]
MGKKKRQKTKELSVAIAEASSKGGDTEQQEIQQPRPPRKRGRPRKEVVVEAESEGKKVEPIEEPEASTATQGTKKEEQHGKQQEELTSATACTRVTKEEGVFEEIQIPKGEPSRSRARRKSKPRKST